MFFYHRKMAHCLLLLQEERMAHESRPHTSSPPILNRNVPPRMASFLLHGWLWSPKTVPGPKVYTVVSYPSPRSFSNILA